VDDSAEEEDYKPAKNGRANKKAKKEEDVTNEDEKKETETGAKPKKTRAKKLVTTEEDAAVKQEEKDLDVDVKPARKTRASKMAKKEDVEDRENEDFVESNSKPVRKGRGRTVKKELVEEEVNLEEHDQVDAEIKPAKSRGKRAATKESANIHPDEVKAEGSNGISMDVKPVRKRRGRAAAKGEDANEINGLNQVPENDAGSNLNLVNNSREASLKKEATESNLVARREPEGHGPVDPKERVQDGFVDKDGPLYCQFREWVEADVCGNKWSEFLSKMRKKLADAGEIDGEDLDECLDKMTELESAGKPLQDGLPKKSSGLKKK
jgi:hypothetical protein